MAAFGGMALTYLGQRSAGPGSAGAERAGPDPQRGEFARRLPARVASVDSFDGTRLRIEIVGPEDAPTLVLVHGLALSQQIWHYQRRDLCDRFRVVTFDLRGHGGSEEAASGIYSASALGRDVASVIARCVPGDRPLVLVGHSLGGMAALACVEQFPDLVGGRIAGMAFLNTAASQVIGGLLRSTAVGTLSAVQSIADSRLSRWYPGRVAGVGRGADDLPYLLTQHFGLGANATPAIIELVKRLNGECGHTVKAALGSTLSGIDLVQAAGLVTVPALVLVGGADRLTPPSQARRLAAALTHASLVEIPGVGHVAMLEAHELVTGRLAALADEVLGRNA